MARPAPWLRSRPCAARKIAKTLRVETLESRVVPAYTPTGLEQLFTDRPDYSPEETVLLTGTGFDPVANLLIEIVRPDGSIVIGTAARAMLDSDAANTAV